MRLNITVSCAILQEKKRVCTFEIKLEVFLLTIGYQNIFDVLVVPCKFGYKPIYFELMDSRRGLT